MESESAMEIFGLVLRRGQILALERDNRVNVGAEGEERLDPVHLKRRENNVTERAKGQTRDNDDGNIDKDCPRQHSQHRHKARDQSPAFPR